MNRYTVTYLQEVEQVIKAPDIGTAAATAKDYARNHHLIVQRVIREDMTANPSGSPLPPAA